ncbi:MULTISPECIES: RluA family pseudouridine synthase [Holospora]|uniref:Pseudouridine synthase n=2 Tax=Holospora TaxID=44747 RepID=A0A061JG89_9PROT|nr:MULTISPECIES: RluA family pseudouridine synthase [Holospora]ETZ04976.1 ribosomal large subunit pseudouridine synthase D [Holospora undulata HU1]GAJ46137.1 ribosomal large subunit pseudouridine synthase D [Holospora elegans E1]
MVESNKIYTLCVDSEFSGIRLDQFLAKRLPKCSRTCIQNMLEQGQVKNSEGALSKKHQSMKVSFGTVFRVEIFPPKPCELKPISMLLDILYEDEDIVAINKPAGQVVHPSIGHQEDSLVHGLLAHCKNQLSELAGHQRPGIVHRLDQFTSGALLVAKNDLSHRHLSEQFAQRRIRKTYWAIVYACPTPLAGRVEVHMGRHPRYPLRMSVSLTQGKVSITRYRTKARSKCQKYSLVECFPETGRTHQIRVHLAHLGNGIVGDHIYGRPHKDLSRQGLHAYQLSFTHPTTNENVSITSKIPEDMMIFLQLYFDESTIRPLF